MVIVSSEITWDLLQNDGRHNVRETHTDDQGLQYVFDYWAEVDTDINVKLVARAQELKDGGFS